MTLVVSKFQRALDEPVQPCRCPTQYICTFQTNVPVDKETLHRLENLLLNSPSWSDGFSDHTKSTFVLSLKPQCPRQQRMHAEVTLDYRSMSQRPKLEARFIPELLEIYKRVTGDSTEPVIVYMDPPITHPYVERNGL